MIAWVSLMRMPSQRARWNLGPSGLSSWRTWCGQGSRYPARRSRESSPSNYVLDVVGSCDVEPAYARRVRDSAFRRGLAVYFHGVVDHHPLAAILEKAHALVIPSQFEGFGIAYLEGMAHGLPALGTTAGAIPELVSDGIDGFLIAPGDAASLGPASGAVGQRSTPPCPHGHRGAAEVPVAAQVGRIHGADQDLSTGNRE